MMEMISYSFHISSKANALTTSNKLLSVANHNQRSYDSKDYDKNNISIIVGSENLYKDVKKIYDDEFTEPVRKYNENKIKSRQIDDYFKHVSTSNNDIAVEVIIQIGDCDFWKEKTSQIKTMDNLFKSQVEKLQELIPDFKIANAAVHYDELSPHMHVVGVPVSKFEKGLEKRVSKRRVFTQESLKMLQKEMRQDIQEHLKEYDFLKDEEFKGIEKGRNKDIPKQSLDEYYQLLDEKDVLEFEKTELQEENKALEIKKNQLGSEFKSVEKQLEQYVSVSKVMNDTLKNINARVSEKQQSISQLDEKISSKTEELNDAVKSLNLKENELNDLDIALGEKNSNLRELQANFDMLEVDVKEKQQSISQLDEKISSKTEELNDAQENLITIQNDINHLQEELRNLDEKRQNELKKYKQQLEKITVYEQNREKIDLINKVFTEKIEQKTFFTDKVSVKKSELMPLVALSKAFDEKVKTLAEREKQLNLKENSINKQVELIIEDARHQAKNIIENASTKSLSIDDTVKLAKYEKFVGDTELQRLEREEKSKNRSKSKNRNMEFERER